jgi:hypothetical protein
MNGPSSGPVTAANPIASASVFTRRRPAPYRPRGCASSPLRSLAQSPRERECNRQPRRLQAHECSRVSSPWTAAGVRLDRPGSGRCRFARRPGARHGHGASNIVNSSSLPALGDSDDRVPGHTRSVGAERGRRLSHRPHGSHIRSQSSVAQPLGDLRKLGSIDLNDEEDRQPVLRLVLARRCPPLPDASARGPIAGSVDLIGRGSQYTLGLRRQRRVASAH